MNGLLIMAGANVPDLSYPLPGEIPASGSIGWTTTESRGIFFSEVRDARILSVAVTFVATGTFQEFEIIQVGGNKDRLWGVSDSGNAQSQSSYSHFFGPEGLRAHKGFYIGGTTTRGVFQFATITYKIT